MKCTEFRNECVYFIPCYFSFFFIQKEHKQKKNYLYINFLCISVFSALLLSGAPFNATFLFVLAFLSSGLAFNYGSQLFSVSFFFLLHHVSMISTQYIYQTYTSTILHLYICILILKQGTFISVIAVAGHKI